MRKLLRSIGPKPWLIPLVVVVMTISAAPATGDPPTNTRFETRVYLAGTGVSVDCSSSNGGACFPLQGDEIEAAITVVDDSGHQPAGANYEFRGAGGVVLDTGSLCDTATATVPPGATQLAVMVAVFDPIGCSGVAMGTTGKVHLVTSLAEGGAEPIHAEPQECLQPLPGAISVGGLTEPVDEGQRVTLDILVLLDGVDRKLGQELMAKAVRAYEPLGIDFRTKYREVTLDSGPGMLMLSHSIDAVGGEVPKGFDIVHTLTAKSMNVWGQADCIGGVRYRDRAFSVSTGTLEDRPVQYIGGPAPIEGRMINDLAAKIVAHEIGHTMGGHHHYGNCVETQVDNIESCTIMMDPGDPKEFQFSAINGAIVRAHAVRYASP